MKRSFFFALCLFLLPISLYAQGATPVGAGGGSIQLTVTTAGGQPVSGAVASYVAEGGQTFGSCTTDGAGRCTITVQDAPTGASGLLRGAVVIEGRGRRPVIWPSGQSLELAIQLDEAGQLGVPYDIYPTRTPNPVERQATASAQAEATVTETVVPTEPEPVEGEPVEATSTTSAIPPTPSQSDSTATATATAPPATGKSGRGSSFAVGIALVVGVIFMLVALYLLAGRKEQP